MSALRLSVRLSALALGLASVAGGGCRYGYESVEETALGSAGASAGAGFDEAGTASASGSGASGAASAAGNGGASGAGSSALGGTSATSGGTGATNGGSAATAGGGSAATAGGGSAGAGGSGGSVGCGSLVAPTLPASYNDFTVKSAALNGGGNTVVLAPGAAFTLDLGYVVADRICPSCVDQMEIGFDPGPVSFCAFSKVVGSAPTAGSGKFQMTAPSTPGLYQLKFGMAQAFVCTGVADNCGSPKAPACGGFFHPVADDPEIAAVCVQ